MSRTAHAASLALCLLLGAGCSLLLDTADPVQCATDADCASSPLLRNRVCQQGFCVEPKVEPTPVTDPPSGCTSTDACTRMNSNEASVCKKVGGPCIPWQTRRCPYISGAWRDPNAIVFGDLQPFTVRQFDGSRRPVLYAERVRRAIDLALSDFEKEAPGGFMYFDGQRRPFAVLHCDSGLYPDDAREAVVHLTQVVGVQAMIVGADEDLAAITPELTASQTAIACSDCIGPFPPGPLAWRILPRLALEAPMAAWRVSDLEARIKSGPNPPAVFKVAVLMSPGRATDAFVSALTDALRFNGKPASDNGDAFTIVRTENPTQTSVNHTKHAETIAAFAPDVVVVAMGADFPTYYLPLIEQKWAPGARRPHYITTDLNFHVATFTQALEDDDVRRRVSGTRPGWSPELQANIEAFTSHYRQAYSFQPPDGSHSGYDAFYALAYATLAAGSQPLLDGPHISAGFERLLGGPSPTDFRPANIPYSVALLGQASAKLDVRGLWSELDWDPSSRDMDADVSMYCFERSASGKLVVKENAGPQLSTRTGVVTGEYACD